MSDNSREMGYKKLMRLRYSFWLPCSHGAPFELPLFPEVTCDVAEKKIGFSGFYFYDKKGWSYGIYLEDSKKKTLELISDNLLPPHMLSIEVTSKCNLSCKYCYVDRIDSGINRNELNTSELTKLIEEAIDWGVPYFSITGGEPFIRNDIFDILSILDEYERPFGIFSNGTLIDKEKASRLSKFAYLSCINLSLDSHKPEINDLIRGIGSFEKTTQAIENLKSYSVPLMLNAVITKYNSNYLSELVNFSEKLGLVVELSTLKSENNSSGDAEKESIAPSYESLQDVERIINENGGDSASPYSNKELFHFEDYSLITDEWYKTQIDACGCPGGRFFAVLSSKGFLRPCYYLLSDFNADALEHGLNASWHSEQFIRFREKYKKCSKCSIESICGGACKLSKTHQKLQT